MRRGPGPPGAAGRPPPRGTARMRKTGRALILVAAAAVAAGMAAPALAATARHGPGSGQSAVDWNRELITILGTPGAQPATVHPTRSFALLQAAEYDAVTSITHA